ncbi:MAG: sugar porter family MFS transporter [Phycisphaerales bacterium]|nr:sugar porter family MFS transporter [Phycisphaerales bacterium]
MARKEIRQTLIAGEDALRKLLYSETRMSRLAGIRLAILQQVTGINIVMYFAPEMSQKTCHYLLKPLATLRLLPLPTWLPPLGGE